MSLLTEGTDTSLIRPTNTQDPDSVHIKETTPLYPRTKTISTLTDSIKYISQTNTKIICGFVSTVLMLSVGSNLLLAYQFHLDFWTLIFLAGSELIFSLFMTLLIFSIALKMNDCIKQKNGNTPLQTDINV